MKTIRPFTIQLFVVFILISCSSSKNAISNHYPEEKFGWKLGSQAYTFRLFTFAEAVDKIDSCGLRYVELFPGQVIGDGSDEKIGPGLSAAGRAKVKQLAKNRNLTIHAFGVVNANDVKGWKKIFEFAKDMGVKVINVEPAQDQLGVVSDLCDEYKIQAALHNHPVPSRYWNPDTVLASLVDCSSYMGAAADIGHWMRSGLDPVECLQKLQGKVMHIHFKDLNRFGDKSAHDVHWGTGKLPVREIIAELIRQKFEGMISAEYEHNWTSSKDDVMQSVANFRSILKE